MAVKAYNTKKLKENLQFGWTDEISIINNIVMGNMDIPSIFLYIFYKLNL